MNTRDMLDTLIDFYINMTEEEEKKLEEDLEASGVASKLISVDGKESLSAKYLASGVNFFQKFKDEEEHDMDFLELSCECGLYNALVERVELNCDQVKDHDTPEEKKVEAIARINTDLDRLGKLYWTVGYIYACRVILDIGDYYDESKEENSGALTRHFYNEAAKHYYRARMLLNQPESERLIQVIYKGEGIEDCGWKSFEAAEADVLAHLEPDRRNALLCDVQKEMKDMLKENKSHQPRGSF